MVKVGTGRVFSFDLMRIIAVAAVIMIHTVSTDVATAPISSSDFVISNIFSALSRLGVPIFVMISGSLMLNEDKAISDRKILKNALIFFLILCFWSLFYAWHYEIFLPLVNNEEISLKSFASELVGGRRHLWYMFMIIGLYLLTPILRLLVKRANAKYILYFIMLALVFQFSVPLVNFIFNELIGKAINAENFVTKYAGKFYLDFLGKYVVYYLIGWYVTNIEIKKKYRIIIYLSGLVGALVTVLGNQIFSTDTERVHGLFFENIIINVLCYSTAVFVWLYYLFKDKNTEKYEKTFAKISNITFGTYLMHVVVLTTAIDLIEIDFVLAEILIIWLVTFVISYLLSYIISKIPFVKLLIRC